MVWLRFMLLRAMCLDKIQVVANGLCVLPWQILCGLYPPYRCLVWVLFLLDHEYRKYQCWQLATCLHDIITSNSLIYFWRGLWLVITCHYFFIWDSYFTSFGWQRTNITQYSSSFHLPPLLSSSFGESTSAYTCNFDPCITPHNFWQCASSLHGLSYLLSSHGSCWSYMIVSILGV